MAASEKAADGFAAFESFFSGEGWHILPAEAFLMEVGAPTGKPSKLFEVGA